jgi:hypothetical protein
MKHTLTLLTTLLLTPLAPLHAADNSARPDITYPTDAVPVPFEPQALHQAPLFIGVVGVRL